jgi:hypothetical protein
MQIMWRKVKQVLLCAAPFLLSGCMTHSLWTGELVESVAEPSVPNRLALYAAPGRQDVLAQYEELSPWHESPHQRAYFVRENINRNQSSRKPHFVSLGTTNGLTAIPLYESDWPTSTSAVYAATSTNGNRFTIFSANGQYDGSFELPTYRSASGRLKLVLLTPVTAVLDVSIVGGVVGYIYLNMLASSGGSYPLTP